MINGGVALAGTVSTGGAKNSALPLLFASLLFLVVLWIMSVRTLEGMWLHFLGVIRIGILYRQFRADAGTTSNVT